MCLSQWFIMVCLTVLYQYHYEEWYVYHSDLSCYVSDCTVSVSLWRVICLSQWFIMLCLWLYCISITMKSDMSITVIYHAIYLWLYCISITMKSDMSITVIYHDMSLTVLYLCVSTLVDLKWFYYFYRTVGLDEIWPVFFTGKMLWQSTVVLRLMTMTGLTVIL
jgi:hypothetical protein